MEPEYRIPEDLPIETCDSPGSAIVTRDTKVQLKLVSGSGGAASGGLALDSAGKPDQWYQLKHGDILTWIVGQGGEGGYSHGSVHGKDGGRSIAYLNEYLLTGDMFSGENPVPGGKGGRAPSCESYGTALMTMISRGGSGTSGNIGVYLAK